MANKYDLELALDSYRAQNGKESEVGLMDSGDVIQYGSQRFSSREQAMWWLKQQKPNHDAIQKMIAEERKNYPNSGLGPLMDTYEKYYKQVQAVQSQTEKKLGEEKVVPKAEEPVQTIPGETRRVDGLPEPTRYPTTPPVPQSIPGETRRTDGLPESPRYPIAPPPVSPVKPQTIMEPPLEKEELSTSDALKQLNAAMGIFRSTTRDVSKKSGTFFDTPEEIEKYRASVNEALKKVLPILRTLESQQLSKTDKAVYDKTVLEIAKYFDNTLDGVKNRHYRNYDLAFDLALSLIKDDLKKQSIKIPTRPSQKELLQSLKSLDPKLQKKIEADMRAGYDLGQILANPQVRSQWESVYEKVYGKYEDEMQTLLKSLKDKRPTMASAEGQRALDTMISIMGTKDFWDIKSRNRDLAGQTAGMVGSTVAGIGAFMVTPLTGGTSAILGGAILSGVVTTAGIVVTKGRGGLDRETAVEFGINTVTFGAGGALAKGANMIAKSGTMLARTAGIVLDATGGLALGMGAEHVRAWEADTSIILSDSFKNNWYWALLPIALGAKGALRNKADAIQDQMGHAAQQAHLGDTVGAKATVAKAEKAAAELAPEIKAQQAAAHPTPSDLPPGGLDIGKNVKGATPEVAGETHAPTATAKAKTSASSVSPDTFHAAEASPSHPTSRTHHPNAKNASNYKFEGWKTIDKILLGDARKFREIFPMADNNMWQGIGKLTKGEMKIGEAIHNSAAWVQNQTFSQIYREMAMPWRGDKVSLIKSAGDNIRTLLISGESGKWMSKDRLGKLGIIVSAVTLDYVTSDQFQKNANGLGESIAGGVDFVFGKYILNPEQAMKLYQEIILLNWVSIVAMNAGAIVGAGTGIAGATLGKATGRLTEVPAPTTQQN